MKYKSVTLGDVIEFNPKEALKKNAIAKKVPMDALKPFTRKIDYFETAEFKSGTKFKNNDTLMARITPCLENGKTSFVDILEENEVGFGSTEYFVLRAVEEKILPKYLYYLSISKPLRNAVIKSMTGTSGRQRAQKEALLNFQVFLPSILEQKKILRLLDSIDSKIELNNQIIDTLEEIASTLFKRWFVDFEFPDENGNPYKSSGGKMIDSELGEIPKGWEVTKIGNLMENYDRHRIPLSKLERQKRQGEYPYYGAASKMDTVNDFIFNGVYLLLGEDGTVVDEKGYPVLQYVHGKFWVNNHAHVLQGKKELNITTEWLKLWFSHQKVNSIITGAVQPKISQKNLNNMDSVLADKKILISFNDTVKFIFSKILTYETENSSLVELRDTLLPKLLSGEIEV